MDGNAKNDLFAFENLSGRTEIIHYISKRNGGVSKGDLRSLNMSFAVNDKSENVKQNRSLLAAKLGIELRQLVFPQQTHSAEVRLVDSTNTDFDDVIHPHLDCTDAIVTNEKGVCISVLVADCTPVLIYDPVQKVVAAIHAGWRGTVGLIAQKAAFKMKETFDSKPSDMLVGIGPSIGPNNYEIGSEVIEKVENVFGKKANLILNKNADKGYFDLWNANKRQLLDIGVRSENIEIAGICTFENNETYFSARHSRGKGGRFAAGIMLI